jgi:hypothetical protein
LALPNQYNIRPASEDPLGDPADQQAGYGNVRPASEDPLGDPADQDPRFGNVLPASQDPLGDPADQQAGYGNVLPASQDPLGDPADQMGWQGGGQQGYSGDPYGDPALQQWAQQHGQRQWSDHEAVGYYDQFAGHPQCVGAQCEYLTQVPPQQFQQQAYQAAQQMPQQQRQQVAGDLMGALQGRGFDLGQIAGMLGLGSSSPQQMGPNDLGKLLGWTQQNQPDALGQAVGNNPGFMKHLGNPMVQGVLKTLAGKLFGR